MKARQVHARQRHEGGKACQEVERLEEHVRDNGRMGFGSSYEFGKRLRMDMELSDGDLGAGGRLGTNYLLSDRTNLYLNYALENERTDTGLRTRRGNLISGVKRRLSDSSSVYVEERYQDADLMSGLTHATGVTLTANDRWNLGANMEVGTLTASQTGAETERRAGGIRIAYGVDTVQISSGIEFRFDDAQQLDATTADRTTWLFRNNFKYQVTPDWRLVGQLNHSFSDSSLGQFYEGGYTEAVIGYGYRPVLHDRFSALAKYTYFYNVPTTDQVTPQGMAAQFLQKSHIAAVDLTYDITENWSIGGMLWIVIVLCWNFGLAPYRLWRAARARIAHLQMAIGRRIDRRAIAQELELCIKEGTALMNSATPSKGQLSRWYEGVLRVVSRAGDGHRAMLETLGPAPGTRGGALELLILGNRIGKLRLILGRHHSGRERERIAPGAR